jgi:hypothetical protein
LAAIASGGGNLTVKTSLSPDERAQLLTLADELPFGDVSFDVVVSTASMQPAVASLLWGSRVFQRELFANAPIVGNELDTVTFGIGEK